MRPIADITVLRPFDLRTEQLIATRRILAHRRFSASLSVANLEGDGESVLSENSHKCPLDNRDLRLKDAVFNVLGVVPEAVRRLLRPNTATPEGALELLRRFRAVFRNGEDVPGKVESLWEIFKHCSEQRGGVGVGIEFTHLPQAYEIMGSLLTEVRMYIEADSCFSDAERQGFPLVSREIFGELIRGYAGFGYWDMSVRLFDQMRSRGFITTAPCYESLLSLLVKKSESRIALRICNDMLDQDIFVSDAAKAGISNLVNLLCEDGRIQEARDFIKKAARFGYAPCGLAAKGIFQGYCRKRDFEDLVSFSLEFECPPDVKAGNSIIQTLCSNYGTERANQYRLELERVGFTSDEISFGILIGWCCRERNLKGAFRHVSEMLERGLRPELYTYNALLSGLFRERMWKHASHIVDEMRDEGIGPDPSTYKIILAGYCKERQFDEVMEIVQDMSKLGLIELSSTEDPICRAFSLLGFDPLAVRLKRDGNVGLSRTEFYDSLGNGLYLDTDVDEFDRKLDEVFKRSILPDFNCLIMQESVSGNLELALRLIDKSDRWGQELSLRVLSTLMKSLCMSRFPVKTVISILAKFPNYVEIDEETLDMLLQLYISKGLHLKAWNLLKEMAERGSVIRYESYSSFIKCLCKKGDSMVVAGFLSLMLKLKCSLQGKDFKALIRYLCLKGMVSQAVELFENFRKISTDSLICCIFIEELCNAGFASIAYRVVQKMPPGDRVLESRAYSHLIRGFCGEKSCIKALEVYNDMKSKQMIPCADALVEIIPFLLEAGRFAEVILLKNVILRNHPDVQRPIEFALFKGYCMANVLGDAARLFRNILVNQTTPSDKACDMMLRAVVRLGHHRKAEELLGVMIREDIPFTISIFRMMAKLMSIGGRVLHVLNLKEILLREGQTNDRIIIYTVMIFSAFTSKNTLLVEKILDEMHSRKVELAEASYNFLVHGFSRCNDLSRAGYYLSAMTARDMRPSTRSLSSIIYRLNDSMEVGKMLRKVESRGWLYGSTVQNAIIYTLVDHGMLSEAEAFVDRTMEKGLVPNGIIYDSLIRELCARKKPIKAFHLLNVMLRKKSIPSTSCYNALVCELSRSHDLETALDVHAEMMWREIKPSFEASDAVIQECCKVERTREAEKFLMSMIRNGEKPSREVFGCMISQYRSENNTRKASELINVMRWSGYEPDFETQWSIISKLKSSEDKSKGNRSKGFLLRILSGFGVS